QISYVKSLDMFFAPKVLKSFEQRGISDFQLQVYVINMLKQYAVNTEEQKEISSESIIRFMHDIETDSIDLYSKLRKYRLVGDYCFFTASLRDGQLNKYFRNIDFCVSWGSTAYGKLGSMFNEMQKKEAALYLKLSREQVFRTLVDAVKDAVDDDSSIDFGLVLPGSASDSGP
ncbi:MAG: hypothetical protein DRP09_21975, partial [Candidatus Thorarchaeota archaeon]